MTKREDKILGEAMRILARRRRAKISPAQRSEIARNAALARHSRLTPAERSEEARARWRKRRRHK